jgi:hypothetical protein
MIVPIRRSQSLVIARIRSANQRQNNDERDSADQAGEKDGTASRRFEDYLASPRCFGRIGTSGIKTPKGRLFHGNPTPLPLVPICCY